MTNHHYLFFVVRLSNATLGDDLAGVSLVRGQICEFMNPCKAALQEKVKKNIKSCPGLGFLY